MITAGRASRAPRLADEVVEQVGVAAMEAVEHADDDEERAVVGLERVDALADRIVLPRSRRRSRGAGGVEQDLVRRELRRREPGDRDEPAGLVDEADRRVRRRARPRRRARRSAWPRPIATIAASGTTTVGRLEAGVDRQEQRRERRPGPSAAAARTASSVGRVVERERPAGRPRQRAEVRRRCRPPRRGRGRATGRTCPPSTSTSTIATGSPAVVSSQSTSSSASIVTARGASSTVSPGPGHRVGPAAGDLDRAVGGRPLLDRRRGSAASAASTAARVGGGPATGVSSPSRSSVVDDAPKQTVAR